MAIKDAHVEKRRYKRVKTNLVFSYQIVKPLSLCTMKGWSAEVKALIFDMGEGGVSFLTNDNIPKWAILFMKFDLISSDFNGKEQVITMEAIGEVRYNFLVGSKEGKYRLGVSFLHINDEDRRVIADFVSASKNRTHFTKRGNGNHRIIYWKNGVFSKKLPRTGRDAH